MSDNQKIYVVGHKNPDTDSICSAICYAELKRRITGEVYEARRAGNVNEETQYVLDYFGVEAPEFLPNVYTQVKDIQIQKLNGVDSGISMKKAYTLMRSESVGTLPITNEEGKLEGLITIGDIAKSYMAVYDNNTLAEARTQYRNIIDTIDGKMLAGNEHAFFMHGKVVVATATPGLLKSYIRENDLVLVEDSKEAMICAMENNASCIIVCEGAKVDEDIIEKAEEKSCVIISTSHDTFTVARLVNQSVPIKRFMTKDGIVSFRLDEPLEEVKGTMTKFRHRDFPILDGEGKYVGMISRRSLLKADHKKVILVDHNEMTQTVDGIKDAEILEVIDHHKIGDVSTAAPIYFRNQPVGCTATIIYQMYQENNQDVTKEIAGMLCSAIISDTLMFRSPTCTPVDKETALKLAEIAGINVEEYAMAMFKAGSNLSDKTPEEIFYQDFKKFNAGDVNFGVGQISSMAADELFEIADRLKPYIEKACEEQGLDMIFFMLTDILEESTNLIYAGGKAGEFVEKAYGVPREAGDYYKLAGVVSRKKQLIPTFMAALQ